MCGGGGEEKDESEKGVPGKGELIFLYERPT
jgi:hypothetical protein